MKCLKASLSKVVDWFNFTNRVSRRVVMEIGRRVALCCALGASYAQRAVEVLCRFMKRAIRSLSLWVAGFPFYRHFQLGMIIVVICCRRLGIADGIATTTTIMELAILTQADVIAHHGLELIKASPGGRGLNQMGGILEMIVAALIVTHVILFAYYAGELEGQQAIVRGGEEFARFAVLAISKIGIIKRQQS